MTDVEQKLVNQILFMKEDMKIQDEKIRTLQAALKASQDTTTSLLRFMEPTNPILASQLRCMRVRQESAQMRKAMSLVEKTFTDVNELKKEKKLLLAEVKEIKKAAAKYVEENSRGSARSLAAENAKLRAELFLMKKYIR